MTSEILNPTRCRCHVTWARSQRGPAEKVVRRDRLGGWSSCWTTAYVRQPEVTEYLAPTRLYRCQREEASPKGLIKLRSDPSVPGALHRQCRLHILLARRTRLPEIITSYLISR